MIDKERKETRIGMVTEALPNTLFRVKMQDLPAQAGEELLAYLSGKMRLNRIKVMVGDSVEVVLDSYGGRGRIVRRIDSRKSDFTG